MIEKQKLIDLEESLNRNIKHIYENEECNKINIVFLHEKLIELIELIKKSETETL